MHISSEHAALLCHACWIYYIVCLFLALALWPVEPICLDAARRGEWWQTALLAVWTDAVPQTEFRLRGWFQPRNPGLTAAEVLTSPFFKPCYDQNWAEGVRNFPSQLSEVFE